MKASKILSSDVKDMRISSLPSCPTAPKALGGRGYSAAQMKAAFDRLPLYIIERYNDLMDDISAVGDESLASAIPSGIKDEHSLSNLFDDIKSGELSTYFSFLGKSLLSHIIGIYGELASLKSKIDAVGHEKEGEN